MRVSRPVGEQHRWNWMAGSQVRRLRAEDHRISVPVAAMGITIAQIAERTANEKEAAFRPGADSHLPVPEPAQSSFISATG
jgi:hypothetical protein